MSNEILGYMPCPETGCSQQAAVMQAKRKGAHLYTRCPDCGIDQRTGKARQLNIWRATTWKVDPPTPPANIEGDLVAGEKPKPKQTAIQEDWSPELEAREQAAAQTAPATDSEPKPKPKTGLVIAGIGLLAGLGLVAASI
ncbi:hypothetical protein [Microbulbifer taiwanensis]|uniref:Zf-TFIIB domain-containing protein n=2 Tax=Microbulbifer taiwanensis TaxID=986746 RepID=A0ABW1YSP2_9GAMM